MNAITATPDASRHPCFNPKVKGECGRVHLPVAPACNIQCGYCNRKYDCVNESRPGVTSSILTPAQALAYMDKVLAREPRITVAGIAGPGDPFANAEATLETMRLIRAKHPHMLFCVSSNGLGVPEHLDAIAQAGITHMTITVNAVDPEIGQHFYRWARDGKVTYQGRAAAELLIARQLESIKGLKERGILVKVNTILTPGLNDGHIEEIAQTMAALGVDLLNIMALIPNAGTPFETQRAPTKAELDAAREAAGRHLPQMLHCKRCRADAVGLLGNDLSGEMAGCLSACAAIKEAVMDVSRPHVAVATMEGMLVNEHLGEALRFQVWTKKDDGGFALVDERPAPAPGGGPDRWYKLAALLVDCRAVLVSGIGDTPRTVLEEEGIVPVEMEGFIDEGLAAVYGGGDLTGLRSRRKGAACSVGCKGGGDGC
ncbi:Radical SAM domain protein [Alkalidesulfovibrio alkalitolerans DSM 16529]|uniref:FeMo cofactor biosynthesis protein NifB n=1 Tax=Alkalidesulfovibrio alkalitolerans DSM 16529 TaxID=1121439 RepID=S7UTM7_9BACT|nr:Radical SAM domain protein [Alkalidesulfovibrio alkalitolerans DSM 16529]